MLQDAQIRPYPQPLDTSTVAVAPAPQLLWHAEPLQLNCGALRSECAKLAHSAAPYQSRRSR
eukprot:7250470-Prorocentrum_lima.AAC.1